jgi:hypothetical protein
MNVFLVTKKKQYDDIIQGQPNGRSRTILKSIMLEFIFRDTSTKINRGCSEKIVDKLYANMFFNNYSYSIIKNVFYESQSSKGEVYF